VKQIAPIVALAALLACGVFFVSNWKVTTDQPGGLQVQPREDAAGTGNWSLPFDLGRPADQKPAPSLPVSAPGNQTLGGDMIRIASFNIQVFGEQKISNPDVLRVLAEIVRHFDIVAVQEIRDEQQSLLPRFVEAINAPGLGFDFVIGPRLGRTTSKEQYAYIFNTDTIEVDRRAAYTVADPDDLLHREPYVASFRCRRAEPDLAFTFTLVNIHTDPTPQTLREELTVLDDVFQSVRSHPRGEDDVILLGDFNANYQHLGDLNRMPNLIFAVTNSSAGKLLATNITGKAQYDNIVFDRAATQEFLGRSGVFDFLREYNLSQAQAKLVSDHLPVWAEFSIYEGGVPGRVAARPTSAGEEFYNPRGGYRDEVETEQAGAFDPYATRSASRGGYRTAPRDPQYTADPRYRSNPGTNYLPPRATRR
jgi:endonuclease/exonuclease/phosphatase family metal-dependent hydrolase